MDEQWKDDYRGETEETRRETCSNVVSSTHLTYGTTEEYYKLSHSHFNI
jgi:hypothetical protein